MKVFIDTRDAKTLVELGYQELSASKADDSNFIVKDNTRYNYLGRYSIRASFFGICFLVLKASAIAILTLGIGIIASRTVRANFVGKRVDHLYVSTGSSGVSLTDHATKSAKGSAKKTEHLETKKNYYPMQGEDIAQFRAKIFQETKQAYLSGYVKDNTTIKIDGHTRETSTIKIDNEPMLKETVTYGQVAPLNPKKSPCKTQFSVMTEDTLQVMLKRKAEGGNPVGINMANRQHPGGGVEAGCPAQEEAICRRTNHYHGLKSQNYPIPVKGGIYCPHVIVFRDAESEGYGFMDKLVEVAFVAVAAYDLRDHSSDRSDLKLPTTGEISEATLKKSQVYTDGTKSKIRNMLRTMASKGHTQLVLGALGCGAFGNPPKVVSALFKEVFNEKEFQGQFERVDFAILKIFKNDQANVDAFSSMCVELNKG